MTDQELIEKLQRVRITGNAMMITGAEVAHILDLLDERPRAVILARIAALESVAHPPVTLPLQEMSDRIGILERKMNALRLRVNDRLSGTDNSVPPDSETNKPAQD